MTKQYYHITARLEVGIDDEAIAHFETYRKTNSLREIVVDAVNARIGTPPSLFRTTQSVRHTVQALDSVLMQRLNAMEQTIVDLLRQAPRNVVLTPPEQPNSGNYQQARNNLIESMRNRKGGAK